MAHNPDRIKEEVMGEPSVAKPAGKEKTKPEAVQIRGASAARCAQ